MLLEIFAMIFPTRPYSLSDRPADAASRTITSGNHFLFKIKTIQLIKNHFYGHKGRQLTRPVDIYLRRPTRK